MRITAGKYKGREVKCPPGVIRPAMEKMRISLFSILGAKVQGASFLDVFSGSGCVGIEAASRGADYIALVEKDFGKKQTILSNLSFVEEKHDLFIMDAYRFVNCFGKKKNFDIIYLDPPFPQKEKIRLLKVILNTELLKPNGLMIIHFPSEEESEISEIAELANIIDTRKYGRSVLKFIARVKIN